MTLAPLILPRLEFPVFCFFLVFWVPLRPWSAVLFCFPLTAALPCVPRPCWVDRPLFFMVAFFLWFWLATVCPVFFLPCFCGVCFFFVCWALSFCAFIFLSFRCSFIMSSDSQCTREKKQFEKIIITDVSYIAMKLIQWNLGKAKALGNKLNILAQSLLFACMLRRCKGGRRRRRTRRFHIANFLHQCSNAPYKIITRIKTRRN